MVREGKGMAREEGAVGDCIRPTHVPSLRSFHSIPLTTSLNPHHRGIIHGRLIEIQFFLEYFIMSKFL